MFDAFLVTWRELAETLLILALLRECAVRAGRADVSVLIRQGLALAAVGIATSAAAIVAFATEPAFDALLTIAAALGVALMATGMAASARGIGRSMSAHLHRWVEGPGSSMMIVALVCFLVLREGLEMFILLRAIARDVGLGPMLSGAALGVVAPGLTISIWAWGRARFGLLVVFRLSAILLLALAISLMLQGLQSLLESRWLPLDHERWLAATAPFMADGRWHAWIYWALLLPPLAYFAKTWWRETDWIDPGQEARSK